jgi:lysophospholipase L1-like esterase
MLLLVSLALVQTSRAAPACSAPREMTRFKTKLPNTARAIGLRKTLVIVALGSSSTEGIGASDRAHAYPALLREELRLRWPQLALTVINKGVRGEIASEMVARFDRDVLAHQPQLVIWQTGSNHALRYDSLDGYVGTIRRGIGRLKEAKADIVLMDLQFAPRVLVRPIHLTVLDSLAAVGQESNVAVFRRFAIMQHWVTSGQYKMEELISKDGLHLNDLSYRCIARLLAGSLAAAVTDSGAQMTRRNEPAKHAAR